MPEDNNPIPLWRRQDLPPTLSRRFEFATYGETRASSTKPPRFRKRPTITPT